jgi:WD40 repeat protein
MEIAEIGIKTKLGIENKKILLTGGSETECSVLVWDLVANEPLKRLSGHDHLISSIIDLGDGASIATASFDSKVAIWDLSENFNCI